MKLFAALFLNVFFLAATVSAGELATLLRRPSALAESADGGHLYVANRDSGSISIVDLATNRVVAEHFIGKRLVDLATMPGTNRLLCVDEAAHELLLLETRDLKIEVAQRLPISPYPVSILIGEDGLTATIASLWSGRLTFVAVREQLVATKVVDLPFAPRCQTRLTGRDRLIVADAFSGTLAIVEPSSQRLVSTVSFPAHNIRGLGVSPDGSMLVVAHQMLNDLAHSIRNDIHWGLLMSNDLRWLRVDSVLTSGEQLYHGAHMHPLGDPGHGGGDPGSLAFASDGTVVVAISGVNEVGIGKEGDFSMQRLPVPQRPTAVRISRNSKLAFIASTLDDKVSIVNLAARKIVATISLGPMPELSLAQQGERLFYDARLSHDGWMSCHSCHTDGHANGQMNDNFSDQSFGAAKRVLSLLGVKDTLPLAWSGQVATLERQIHNSVENTMQREETLPADETRALAAFLKTLELPPPQGVLRGTQDRAAINRGRLVFERRDCGRCHVPPTYTSPSTYDVGLRDALGTKEFNPPSLRGLSHRPQFFHDCRATTLEEVLLKHNHPDSLPYEEGDVRDLVAFLRSL